VTGLWDLLPANVVKYAKGILAAVGAVLTIVFATVPGLSGARWAIVAVAVLAALGVVVVPNQNAKTRLR
jgi:hypothetical protein